MRICLINIMVHKKQLTKIKIMKKRNVMKVKGVILIASLMSCAEKAPPTIVLNGDEYQTIYLGDTYSDDGVVATDYKGNDISDQVEIDGSVGDNAGGYQLQYLVWDKKDQMGMVSRWVSRGYKNSDIEGTYDVSHSANNGGGSYNFTGTVTALTADNNTFTIDNSNCPIAPVMMVATINANGVQFTIPDQSDGGYDIYLAQTNNISGGSSSDASLDIAFVTTSSITYNHTATWTKQ